MKDNETHVADATTEETAVQTAEQEAAQTAEQETATEAATVETTVADEQAETAPAADATAQNETTETEQEAEETEESEKETEEKPEEVDDVAALKAELEQLRKERELTEQTLKTELEAKLAKVTDDKQRAFIDKKGGTYAEKLNFLQELKEAGFLTVEKPEPQKLQTEIGRSFKAETQPTAPEDAQFDGRKSLYARFRTKK